MNRFFGLVLLFCSTLMALAQADTAPSLFVFQNGLHQKSPAEEAAMLKELGYPGVGSAKLNGLKERIATYEAAGLKVFSIYVGAKINANGATYDKRIPEAIEMLKGRNAVVEFTLQGGGPNAEKHAVEVVREVADLAAKAEMKLVLYPHHGFYVARISEALRIIKQVDRPNVGVMFNLCHFLKGEKAVDLEKTIQEAGPYIFQASTCGADSEGNNWGQLIQTLDKGTFDQTRFLNALQKAGFKGVMGLQCYAIRGNPKENLKRSRDAWEKLVGTL